MFERLLIALRLKKKTPVAAASPRIEPDVLRPRYVGHAPPRPMPPPAPPRMTQAMRAMPSPAPAPAQDNSSDLMNAMLLHSLLHNSATAHPPTEERAREPEPFISGRGGDFGGGGATGGWEPPAPAPSYEPPVPSPSYDSGSSCSSDSSSSSSYSSD